MSDGGSRERVTLGSVRKWVRAGEPFAMLTCYDATTARWLWRGGVRAVLVGDTAAQMILGHDSTLPVGVDFMITITAAVRRGAPDAFVMGDMPFGSYQVGHDAAAANAVRFLKEGGADVVKLEVGERDAGLVQRLSDAGVPVVAHIGSRPQHVRARGRYRQAFRGQGDIDALVATARSMVQAGAVMLLIEAVPAEASAAVVEMTRRIANDSGAEITPVVGCGAGPACHGHVIVLHDLLGMTDWHPPFAPPAAAVGESIQNAAAQWLDTVRTGRYLRDDHPYQLDR